MPNVYLRKGKLTVMTDGFSHDDGSNEDFSDGDDVFMQEMSLDLLVNLISESADEVMKPAQNEL